LINLPQSHTMPEAYIYDALRTPRGKGKSSGSLYEIKPVDLLSATLTALGERTGLDPAEVEDTLVGCVTPIDDQGYNIAQAALLQSGWGSSSGSMQLNRYCASGLEAVNMAAMKVRSGWGQLVVAGGVESMSRVPMGSDGGALMYDPTLVAGIPYLPQGVAADLIATIEGFSREMVDSYAYQSQKRAQHAIKSGYFKESVIPIYDQNGLLVLEQDEYPRPSISQEDLGRLPAVFEPAGRQGFDAMALQRYPMLEKIHHVHTAGNSSGIVDGAGMVLVGAFRKGKALGLKPRAKILAAANVSVDPTIMLTGPAPASRKALEKAGMQVSDIDLWECNEAFASVVLKFQKEMGLDDSQVNVNGGAIALGHPLGATGAMLLGTLLDELERQDKSTGCVTLCVGGGMGVATIIERV
jgi:acetyl-CoA C-acetyltransferase